MFYGCSNMPGFVALHLRVLSICYGCRLGSGSACRSLYGGFVKWNMGQVVVKLYPSVVVILIYLVFVFLETERHGH